MRILVLDTVHGGKEIGSAYRMAGNTVDQVDVYHGTTPELVLAARHRTYDLIVAPVHLDPDHPLLRRRSAPVISHHEAVRSLLDGRHPSLMVEITGARGKTTTACALAHLLPGNGVLHTSAGTVAYPGKTLIDRRSITPASVFSAVEAANHCDGWLVAEVSLGVCGIADLSIITSAEDYLIAGGKKSALREKLASAEHAKLVLIPRGITTDLKQAVFLEDVAQVNGNSCTVTADGRTLTLENPLFSLPPYRMPLMLAAAAAMLLGISPLPLNQFAALPGRMSITRENDSIVIDNANSGTNAATTLCAAQYARHCANSDDLTLVIGQAEGDGAVCEGFRPDQIADAILQVKPVHIVWVGKPPAPDSGVLRSLEGRIDRYCSTLEEGRRTALQIARKSAVVLSVKTWR